MKVPTANVIVGFNKEVMDRLFAAGSTYESLVKGLTLDGAEDDVLLFNSESNPNFISFVHDNRKGNTMELSFIDPTGNFEKRFFSDNISRNIAGSLENPIDQQLSEVSDVLMGKANKETSLSQEFVNDELIADINSKLKNHYAQRIFYIAYGTGSNLSYWSGPHRMVVNNASIEVKGAKEITLLLVPWVTGFSVDARRGAYNEAVNFDLAGLTARWEGISKPITFNKKPHYDPTKYLEVDTAPVDSAKGEVKTFLDDLGLEKFAKKVGAFDFHAIIVDTLRSYIQKATGNPNVIVLLPNINIICRDFINKLLANTKVSQAPLPPPMKLALGYLYPAEFGELGYLKNFLTSLLSSFGLSMYEVHKEDSNPGEYLKALPTSNVSIKQQYEKSKDASERFKEFFEVTDFYAVLNKSSNQSIPDHERIIKGVIDKIITKSRGTYPIEFTKASLNETDIRVLDLWSHGLDGDISKSWTFGGYSRFSSVREAIIVGDSTMIKNFIYGRTDLNPPEGFNIPEERAPLHPLDAEILTSNKYNKQIRKITYPQPAATVGAFGNGSDLSDNFDYNDEAFSESQENYIIKQRIPVFRFNMTNPNILDFKSGASNLYGLQILNGFARAVHRKAAGVTEGIIDADVGSLPIRNWESAILYLKSKGYSKDSNDREAILASLAERLVVTDQFDFTAEQQAAMVADIIEMLQGSTFEEFKALYEIGQLDPGDPQSIMTDFLRDMYDESLGLSITTIPFFHISNPWHLRSPAIVYMQGTQIIQSNNKTSSNMLSSYLSGEYLIFGFRHTITSNDAYSEFALTKNNFATGLVDDTEEEDIL